MHASAPLLDVDLILFDLDNTLYPRGLGLWREIDDRIRLFVGQFLGISPAEAARVQKHYWLNYGTTIAGLMAEYRIEPAAYLAFVHDVPLAPYLGFNPTLDALLTALPQRKAIFTNATARHAHNVLAALGVDRHFQHVVGFEEVGYVSKPHPLAYERCLALVDVSPQRCVFIEDSAVNLPPARALGMKTVLVGDGSADADHTIPHIEALGRLFGLDGA
ncbi:MAG: pyrimidine 5'-nucleotidase [Caldilineales bacterium]|nr:pyrimidine 5'-nucleotidase [Caldilineales bacterium]